MAYQNVGTPRFWINTLEYLNTKNYIVAKIPTSGNNWNQGYPLPALFETGHIKRHNEYFMAYEFLKYKADGESWFNDSFKNFMSNSWESGDTYNSIIGFNIPDGFIKNPFIAILGHLKFNEFANNQMLVGVDPAQYTDPPGYSFDVLGANSQVNTISAYTVGEVTGQSILDHTSQSVNINGIYNGFTIAELTDTPEVLKICTPFSNWLFPNNPEYTERWPEPPPMDSIIIGSYWDAPYSPDLSLEINTSISGVLKSNSIGSSSLTDTIHNQPPFWSNKTLPPWQLNSTGEGINKYVGRNSKRSWNLKFSYLQDSSLFPKYTSSNVVGSDGESSSYTEETATTMSETLLGSNDFFSEVVNMTNGGQIPFIFQPDNQNFNPDQFAICKLDMNSLDFKQVSNGVYSINIIIREVW